VRGPGKRGLLWGNISLAAALLWPGPAEPAAGEIVAGTFLYAVPGLDAGHFTESVVLLVRHDDEGSLGLVVNRPTRVPLREAITELEDVEDLDLRLYFGGPVQPEAVLALVRPVKPPVGAERVLPDVYFSTELKELKEAARQPGAGSRLRVYAGYAGWAAGQLASELKAGAWVVGPARASAIFSDDPSTLWPEVHELMRRTEARGGSPALQAVESSTTSSKPTVGEPSAPNQARPSATRSISIR
jgi:putative transcriptional regulator